MLMLRFGAMKKGETGWLALGLGWWEGMLRRRLSGGPDWLTGGGGPPEGFSDTKLPHHATCGSGRARSNRRTTMILTCFMSG